MKKTILIFSFILAFSFSALAQKQIDQKVQRDPVLEADALHNLDVARQYFKIKKAYKAVIMRTEEIVAANPDFSKMDEVLYLSGMSSFYLSKNKGNQKLDAKATDAEKQKFAPEKLREDATVYLSMLVEKYPNSSFRDDAEKTLKELKNVK
ncbi:MAG: outer membrane protein assembly factor BamD [Pyrinomonadaceae bacterium]